ncbi:MAG: putative transport system permease protein [Thermoleophilaceae bacterium]|nr:putative transport system permease protein [Thermoleophilaceae bacterium]
MRRIALKGLLARRVRTFLTGLSIVLGVAMVSGTYVLTDTIEHAFDSIFSGSYKNTSVVISGKQVVKQSASGNATIPTSLLPRVRRNPDVLEAAGAIFSLDGKSDSAKLIDHKGRSIGTGGAPNFAFGFDGRDARFNPLKLTTGAWAAGPDQVVIDKGTADNKHYRVGDRIGVSAQGPTQTFKVTGIARFGNVDSLGGATIAVFDLATAQALLHKNGQLDSIFVAGKGGVPPSRLVSEIQPLLPATAQIKTADQQAAANSKDTKDATRFIQYFLLAFAAIALFVGSFVIYNTLSITVAQRAREFATLRTLGATRRQVMRSVLIEGFVVGLVASVTGLFLGLALAKGLNAVFNSLGLSLPQSGLVFKQRTVIVSLLLGTSITVLSSIAPALRATRVPPIAAVREGAVVAPSRVGRRGPIVGAIAIVIAVAVLGYATFGGLRTGSAMALIGLGLLLALVAIALNAAALVRPLARAIGLPGRRYGGAAGRLASENTMRNPARTASTAAALMIGLALVTLVATLGNALRTSDRNAIKGQVSADYVVTSKNGFDQFAASAGSAAARAPGVRLATSVREDSARAFGRDQRVNGIEPDFPRFFHFHWNAGSDAVVTQLGADGAILEKDYAKKHHLGLGSRFNITTPTGKQLTLRVAGIQSPRTIEKLDPLVTQLVISQAAFDRGFSRPKNALTFIQTGGESTSTTAALKGTLAKFPDARVYTHAAWIDKRGSGLDILLNLLYVLLALSVVVSLFGMVNTLVLSVFERTREVGMLRAVGMTRRQVRRMVRHESVITALIGAGLGLPLGVAVAALSTHVLSKDGVSFALPVGSLVAFTIVAIVAGVLAAIFPARRAARLNVLESLAYE